MVGKILYAWTSEKAVGLIDKNNSLAFAIEDNMTQTDLKVEIEKAYGEKVEKVTTLHTLDGRHKAYVKFKKKGAAADIASKLKIL